MLILYIYKLILQILDIQYIPPTVLNEKKTFCLKFYLVIADKLKTTLKHEVWLESQTDIEKNIYLHILGTNIKIVCKIVNKKIIILSVDGSYPFFFLYHPFIFASLHLFLLVKA